MIAFRRRNGTLATLAACFALGFLVAPSPSEAGVIEPFIKNKDTCVDCKRAPSQQEIAKPKIPGALDYEQGAKLLAAGDYEAALPKLKRAAELWPANVDIQQSLALCLSRLGKYDEAINGLRVALSSQQLTGAQEQKLQESIATIRDSELNAINDHLQPQIDAARAHELDDLARDAKITQLTMQVEERQRQLEAPTITDSNVVDARGPKPLAEVIAAIPELGNSPSAERARKGLMAIANRDWKAARAWYQDALNHDPGNPVLVRAIDLTQWMVDRQAQPAFTSLNKPTLSGSGSELATQLPKFYEQLAQEINAQNYPSAYEKARASYFASEFRNQAVEAQMFDEAIKQAKAK